MTTRRTVGDRVVAYDCKFLRAVLAWAAAAGDDEGGTLLERDPLRRLPYPAEEHPRRVVVTAEEYRALVKVAGQIHPDFECLLVVAHETGHRLSSVRQLRWSDVDLERCVVTWRAASDKIGFEHRTPLTEAAVAVLAARRRRAQAIGDAWLFPGEDVNRDRAPRSRNGGGRPSASPSSDM